MIFKHLQNDKEQITIKTSKMKYWILSTLALINISVVSGQSEEYAAWLLQQKIPHEFANLLDEEFEKEYKVSDYINPFYLTADFDGDEVADIAIAITENETGKAGFVVIHKSTGDYFVIGAGKEMGNGGDDFSWMNIWGTYTKIGDEFISTGILVGQAESAGGIIYWTGTEYKWKQHGD